MAHLPLLIWTILPVATHITGAGATVMESCKMTSIENDFMDCSSNTLACHSASLEDLRSDFRSVNLHKLSCLSVTNSSLKNLEEDALIEGTSLKYLDLQANSLEDLHHNLFNNLKELEYLDLTHNILTHLADPRLFISQNKLKILKLNFNQIKIVDVKVLTPLRSIEEIHISENPLVCDCQTYWTMDWCERKALAGYVKCHAPDHFKGLSWTILRKAESCSSNTTIDESLSGSGHLMSKSVEESRAVISKEFIIYLVLIVFMVLLVIYGVVMLLYLRNGISKRRRTPAVRYETGPNIASPTFGNVSCVTPDRRREGTPYDNVDVCNPKVGNIYFVKDGEVAVEEPTLCDISSNNILNSDSQQKLNASSGSGSLNSENLSFQNQLYNVMID